MMKLAGIDALMRESSILKTNVNSITAKEVRALS